MPPPTTINCWVTTSHSTHSSNWYNTISTASTTTSLASHIANYKYYNSHPQTSLTSIASSNLNSGMIYIADDACSSTEYALNWIKQYMAANCLTLHDIAGLFNPTDAGLTLPQGSYKLPGGAVLTIQADTSYAIDDSQHQTIYKAHPVRNFNEALCVSDVLEKFMDYVASLHLTREQFMQLPIRLFLLWLIVETAKNDGEPVPEPEMQQLELALQPIGKASNNASNYATHQSGADLLVGA